MSIYESEPQDKPQVGGDGSSISLPSDRSTEPRILVQEVMGRGDGHTYAAVRFSDVLKAWSTTPLGIEDSQESE